MKSTSILCSLLNGRIELYSAEKHIGLAWGFHVSPNSCGNHSHYEQYIQLCAASDHSMGLGTTHVFISELDGKECLAGFITLRASALVENINGSIQGKPALEIAELAVDERFAGQHIGSLLVSFALTKADSLNVSTLGVRYVVVCSDPQSSGFYEKCKFQMLNNIGDIPRESWNNSCVPMYMQLPSLL